MQDEAEITGETFKQRVFASSFGSPDPAVLKRYYDVFEKPEEEAIEDGIEEFAPETDEDVLAMLKMAREAGVVS